MVRSLEVKLMADLRHPAKYEKGIIKILRFFLYWFPQCGNFTIFPPFAEIFRQIIFNFFTKCPLQKDVSMATG